MELQKKLKLAQAKKNLETKTAVEARQLRDEEAGKIEKFLSELSGLLDSGIDVRGFEHVDDLVDTVEHFGQSISDTISAIADISRTIPDISELNIPNEIAFKQIADPQLLKVLEELGSQDELISKLQLLDQTIVFLKEAITTKSQEPTDFQPVRIVLGEDNNLSFLKRWPTPQFVGGGGDNTDITAIKGFALGQYDEIDATYPTSSSERYTYKFLGQIIASLLVTYSDSTKATLLSVVKS